MGTDNKSLSYLEEREKAREWLKNTAEGRYTIDLLKREDGQNLVSQVLDDDNWVDWETMVEENRHNLTVASNNMEARNAVDLARKSNTLSAPPCSPGSKMLRIFSPMMWYFLRRQIETMDPEYWNDPKNVLREALKHPEWCAVSPEYIRGELEKYLGNADKKDLPLPDSGPTSEVAGS